MRETIEQIELATSHQQQVIRALHSALDTANYLEGILILEYLKATMDIRSKLHIFLLSMDHSTESNNPEKQLRKNNGNNNE